MTLRKIHDVENFRQGDIKLMTLISQPVAQFNETDW